MIIYVDIDDTLNELKTIFVQKAYQLGLIKKVEPVTYSNIVKCFKGVPIKQATLYMNQIYNSVGFWSNLPIRKEAQRVLKCLHQTHDVYLVTSHWFYAGNNSVMEKIKWINKNLPFINIHNQLIFILKKWLLTGDVIIDDSPEVIEKFKKTTIIMDALYNKNTKADYRAKNWLAIESIFKKGLLR